MVLYIKLCFKMLQMITGAILFVRKVSALESNVGETLCSLKFAQRVCKVELGPASRKIECGGGGCD